MKFSTEACGYRLAFYSAKISQHSPTSSNYGFNLAMMATEHPHSLNLMSGVGSGIVLLVDQVIFQVVQQQTK